MINEAAKYRLNKNNMQFFANFKFELWLTGDKNSAINVGDVLESKNFRIMSNTRNEIFEFF